MRAWWDLDAIEAGYARFLTAYRPLARRPLSGCEAFAAYAAAVIGAGT